MSFIPQKIQEKRKNQIQRVVYESDLNKNIEQIKHYDYYCKKNSFVTTILHTCITVYNKTFAYKVPKMGLTVRVYNE